MPKFNFIVLMRPVGKERARTINKGNSTWSYTPDRTVFAERKIKDSVEGKGAWFPEHIGVKVEATFYRDEPDSPTMKRVRQLCNAYKKPLLPVIAPDVDNYQKTLQDSLNMLTYSDDCQITNITIKKRFVRKGESPRIEFSLEEDNDA